MPTLHFDVGIPGLGALATIGSIILIDIVLSGDNALVIGAAASRLHRTQRLLALLWGGVGAIVMRVVLAAAATILLLIPLLQTIGGIILMFIAVRLLVPEDATHVQAKDRFFPAVLTIMVADVTMSLDNIIAVGALAKGDVTLLVFGLLVSMAALFLASALIARIIERLSFLLDLASLVLAFTAANLVAGDPRVAPYVARVGVAGLSGDTVVHIAFIAFILLSDVVLRVWRAWRGRRMGEPMAAAAASGAVVDSDGATPAPGARNGMSGSANGMVNGMANGAVNGATSSMANGGANGATPAAGEPARPREPVTSQPLAGREPEDSELTTP